MNKNTLQQRNEFLECLTNMKDVASMPSAFASRDRWNNSVALKGFHNKSIVGTVHLEVVQQMMNLQCDSSALNQHAKLTEHSAYVLCMLHCEMYSKKQGLRYRVLLMSCVKRN